MPLCRAYHHLIHFPISRESINESYCEQAFRLIDQRVLPPSQDVYLHPSDFTGTGSVPVEEHSLFTAAGQHGYSTHFPLIAQRTFSKYIVH